ncbi:hypothetical protein P2G88_07285 [Aliiglaciecola sp. CAU 1673]|uniref:FimV/HubP family polar landmark protein n=1 Tax=Aliiglaciecola sp. CAU 1673 TaxID=3032595 RepID=UPI0023D9BE26|nr:FimV/HubP family polar landmark protein [Aliiglaciecola sp. CAU 1673]MDF2178053.1 hypothetical protein [Aliiglaciecola sp. CAU 1673]
MKMRHLLVGLFAGYISLSIVSMADAQQVQIKGPKNSTREYSGNEYGPIDSNDTLWRIAERYRPNKSLSIYQVMLAIYELNPHAFEDKNLNLLINGSMLKLPSEVYAARIDPDEAKARAESDNKNWKPKSDKDNVAPNLKPVQPLASSAEISQTRESLERKLSELDLLSNKQFELLQEQIGASIDSVSALLAENQKIFNRLDSVDQDIEELRSRVGQEGEIQQQMQSLLDLQNQLLDLSRQAEMRQRAEAENSWSNNSALMVLAGVLPALLALGGLAFWLRNRSSSPVAEKAAPVIHTPARDDHPMDNLSDALADELSGEQLAADDDLFGDDLLDDVLTDELQESLDATLDEELKEYDDLEDQLLVPEEKDEDSGGLLGQDELDSLFAEDDLSPPPEKTKPSAAKDDITAIDLSEVEDEPSMDSSEPPKFEEVADWDLDEELDALDDLEPERKPTSSGDEKPEISIDELLNEPMAIAPTGQGGDEDAFLSPDAPLTDELLEQLDKDIFEQGKQLDSLTDEILSEIEQVESFQQNLSDELLEEMEEEQNASEGDRADMDILSDELLGELEQGEEEKASVPEQTLLEAQPADEEFEATTEATLPADSVNQDDLSDELLSELEKAPEEESAVAGQDDLSDELLSELEQAPEEETAVSSQDDLSDELLSELEQAPEEETAVSSQDDLSDELLSELEQAPEEETAVSSQDDLSDELLSELEQAPEEEETAVSSQDDDLSDELPSEPEQSPEPEETVAEAEPARETPSDTEQASVAAKAESVAEELSEQEAEAEAPAEQESDAPEADEEELDDLVTEGFESSDDDLAMADQELADLEKALDTPLEELSEQEDAVQTKAQQELPEESAKPPAKEQHKEPSLDDMLDDVLDDEELEKALSELEDGEFEATHHAMESSDTELEELENELAKDMDELPALGDWLEHSKDRRAASVDDDDVLEELESSDFDQMLQSMEQDDEPGAGLDIETLLNEQLEDPQTPQPLAESEEDFLDIDALLNDSVEAEETTLPEQPLDLDGTLDEFGTVEDDEDLVDVDKDSGLAAKLDLARAYLEMDDKESAIELLQLVVEKGNDEQQEEAKQILDSLL